MYSLRQFCPGCSKHHSSYRYTCRILPTDVTILVISNLRAIKRGTQKPINFTYLSNPNPNHNPNISPNPNPCLTAALLVVVWWLAVGRVSCHRSRYEGPRPVEFRVETTQLPEPQPRKSKCLILTP